MEENVRNEDVEVRGVEVVDDRGRIHNLFAAWRPESRAIEAAIVVNYVVVVHKVAAKLREVEGRWVVRYEVTP